MFDTVPLLQNAARLVEDGGPFVAWIFVVGVLLCGLVLERIWYFQYIFPRQAAEVQQQWQARPDHYSWCARQIRSAMISRINSSMNAGLPIMQVLVPLSPLLGLIGTVTGMLEVFDSMALRGNADARSMASGVSEAMICTMTGLAVSIIGLYPVYYFRNCAARETELLADRMPL